MNDDRLLSIGGFALLTGLSVTTLRHYDAEGVLPAAWVDPETGYRRYRAAQATTARLVRTLRRLELPVDEIRRLLRDPGGVPAILARHRDALARRAEALAALARQTDRLLTEGVDMPAVTSTRIVQATIAATDRAALIAFYQAVFGARFSTEIGSFEFGSWPDDEFFLLTLADEETHPGASGPSRFGLLVADLDAAHARALAAGARELSPPVERPWKPRWSCVADPGGNVVDLYQS